MSLPDEEVQRAIAQVAIRGTLPQRLAGSFVLPDNIIRSVRRLTPQRRLTTPEAQNVAERQALKLLELLHIVAPPVDLDLVTILPSLDIQVRPKLVGSGVSYWTGSRWVVAINGDEPPLRQRLTLMHEVKHVLDHPYIDTLYTDPKTGETDDAAVERLCDYFAGCFLVPRPWLKRAWVSGVQSVAELAELFQVSKPAMQVRLLQTGLVDRYGRHTHRSAQAWYARALPRSDAPLLKFAPSVG